MSKITLYQCDMCHNRGETLRILPVRVPNPPGNDVEYTQYDICDECAEKLNKYIQTFHKTDLKKLEYKTDDEGYIWFVETKQNSKSKWTRENGPFVERKSADKALKHAEEINPSWEHKVSCRVVPAWVVDFIECNVANP